MLALVGPAEVLGDPLRIYQIGNSFTLDSRPEATEPMLEGTLGLDVELGYHVRGSQTLDSLWNNPHMDGTVTNGYGRHPNALPASAWDYLVLQSFPSVFNPVPTLGQEVARIQDFVSVADQGSGGATEIVVYGPWAGDAESRWNPWDDPAPDDPETVTEHSLAYLNRLHDKVAELFPGRTRLANAGAVIWEIRQRIEAGDAPIGTVLELYRDTIHLSFGVGRFIASTVIQTAILGHSQVGQPVYRGTDGWDESGVSDEVAEWVQLVAWEVMLADSRSAVRAPDPGDYDGNGLVDLADYDLWADTLGSSDRLLADGNGDGLVDTEDYTVWRDAIASEEQEAIPEPATQVMMLVAGLLTGASRNGRLSGQSLRILSL